MAFPICSKVLSFEREEREVRLNKGGLIACPLYTVHFCAFYGWALSSRPAESAFLSAIAVPAVFLLAGLSALFGGSEMPFSINSWLNSIPAYYVESLVIFYLVDWGMSALARTSVVPDDTPSAGESSESRRP